MQPLAGAPAGGIGQHPAGAPAGTECFHEVAQADACKMEHLMSLETGRRMLWPIRFILSDPERADVVRKAMATLDDANECVALAGEEGGRG